MLLATSKNPAWIGFINPEIENLKVGWIPRSVWPRIKFCFPAAFWFAVSEFVWTSGWVPSWNQVAIAVWSLYHDIVSRGGGTLHQDVTQKALENCHCSQNPASCIHWPGWVGIHSWATIGARKDSLDQFGIIPGAENKVGWSRSHGTELKRNSSWKVWWADMVPGSRFAG